MNTSGSIEILLDYSITPLIEAQSKLELPYNSNNIQPIPNQLVWLSHFRPILQIPIEYVLIFLKKKDMYFKQI
jgi:hypothetical protein